MKNIYKGLIFTKHALKRMGDRDISMKDIWLTWYKPDQSRYAKSKEAWIYYKAVNNLKIEVVAKKNEKKEWVILSVWSKPIQNSNKS